MYDFQWCLGVTQSLHKEYARAAELLKELLRKTDNDVASLLQNSYAGWNSWKHLLKVVNSEPNIERYCLLMRPEYIETLCDVAKMFLERYYFSHKMQKMTISSPERAMLDKFYPHGDRILSARS